jgi:threonine dehydrogenase-like Zn-dependent dehydrogenase
VRPRDPVLVNPDDGCGLPPCRLGVDTYCAAARMPGFLADGGFAQYLRTSGRGVVHLPAGAGRPTCLLSGCVDAVGPPHTQGNSRAGLADTVTDPSRLLLPHECAEADTALRGGVA